MVAGAAPKRFAEPPLALVFNGHFTSRAGRRALACGQRCARPEPAMNFTAGLLFIAVSIGMLVLARPADGESAPFLKVWIIGQIYALTALLSAVVGVTIVIINRPF
jgi:hypothetical protein